MSRDWWTNEKAGFLNVPDLQDVVDQAIIDCMLQDLLDFRLLQIDEFLIPHHSQILIYLFYFHF